jgi:hypothetical protein
MRLPLAAIRPDRDEAELVPHRASTASTHCWKRSGGRAGLPVELHVDGEPFPLPRGIDLSAYRIVQEGLTNALKHASDADLTVRYRPDELEIEVRDNGQGSATSDGLGPRRANSRAAEGQQTLEIEPEQSCANQAPAGLRAPSIERLRVNRRQSSFPWNKPVTPEVAGSSPVGPVETSCKSEFLLSASAQPTAGFSPAAALVPHGRSAASRTPKVLQTGMFCRRFRC